MRTFDTDRLQARLTGALYGGAIGDAIGAPIEGLRREDILRLVGPVRGFIAPRLTIEGRHTLCPGHPDGKGDGRITDDTLMVEALIEAYMQHADHMGAAEYQRVFAPILAGKPIWLPEWQRTVAVLERLASAEQWHIRSLLKTHRDPRFFGGCLHSISCGASMCAWPVGAANAGDPRGAYGEAVAFFSAQTFSFGLEQAAVMAAAMAEALAPSASPRSVVDAALAVARDATRAMIAAAARAVQPGSSRDVNLPAVHEAARPWHHKQAHIADTAEQASRAESAEPLSNEGSESRLHTSEEMPVALAMLLHADGDFVETVCAAAEYGEDADSIAGMAGSLAGALRGQDAIPAAWRTYSDTQNCREYATVAAKFANIVQAIAQRDQQRLKRRLAAAQ